MVLSEIEAERQLAALRRQRETLDRAIADLTLFLELGRRLTAETGPSRDMPSIETKSASGSAASSAMRPASEDRETPEPNAAYGVSSSEPTRTQSFQTRANPVSASSEMRQAPSPVPQLREHHAPTAGLGGTETGRMSGAVSDGVLARRYGRALIEAALTVLDEAGRPLHASEILLVLTSRGFSLPGHDPVAALNTRLWKRSGPGGPLKRMGDAVYALVKPEA